MSVAPTAVAAARPDGRRLRSERTRVVIMDAFIDLLRERPEVPTAAQIAARAGISTRLIFERFNDLAALSLATVDLRSPPRRRKPRRAASMATGCPASGPTSRRGRRPASAGCRCGGS